MTKKKFENFALMSLMTFCLIFATVLGFAGCNDSFPEPIDSFGRSFSYMELFEDSRGTSKSNPDGTIGPTQMKFIEREFSNLDLANAEFLGTKINLSGASTADGLYKEMNSKAHDEFEKLKAITIKISSKDSKKITLIKDNEETVYNFEPGEFNPETAQYHITHTDGTSANGWFDQQARFSKGMYSIYAILPDGLSQNRYLFKIPTKTIVEDAPESEYDGSGELIKTYAVLEFYPQYSLVTE